MIVWLSALLALGGVEAHRIRLRPAVDAASPYADACWDATPTVGAAIMVWSCSSRLPERQTGWTTPTVGSSGAVTFAFPNFDRPFCVAAGARGAPLTLAACDASAAQTFTNASGSATSGHHYLQHAGGCVETTAPAPANGAAVTLGACSTAPGQPVERRQRWENTWGTAPDVRVAAVVGNSSSAARVRVSVVEAAAAPTDFSAQFAYAEPFRHRWTDNFLYTRRLEGGLDFGVGETKLAARFPDDGARVTGILVGDPCTSGLCMTWEPVATKKGWDVRSKLAAALNLAQRGQDGPGPAADFVALLGDNFYSQRGVEARDFFARLETGVKLTPLVTVPGNHDYWIAGGPPGYADADSYGNGFMQFYGQDTLAATDAAPYDFSVDPDTKAIAAPANFFSYYALGNVGVVTFSDAYDESAYGDAFDRACASLFRRALVRLRPAARLFSDPAGTSRTAAWTTCSPSRTGPATTSAARRTWPRQRSSSGCAPSAAASARSRSSATRTATRRPATSRPTPTARARRAAASSSAPRAWATRPARRTGAFCTSTPCRPARRTSASTTSRWATPTTGPGPSSNASPRAASPSARTSPRSGPSPSKRAS